LSTPARSGRAMLAAAGAAPPGLAATAAAPSFVASTPPHIPSQLMRITPAKSLRAVAAGDDATTATVRRSFAVAGAGVGEAVAAVFGSRGSSSSSSRASSAATSRRNSSSDDGVTCGGSTSISNALTQQHRTVQSGAIQRTTERPRDGDPISRDAFDPALAAATERSSLAGSRAAVTRVSTVAGYAALHAFRDGGLTSASARDGAAIGWPVRTLPPSAIAVAMCMPTSGSSSRQADVPVPSHAAQFRSVLAASMTPAKRPHTRGRDGVAVASPLPARPRASVRPLTPDDSDTAASPPAAPSPTASRRSSFDEALLRSTVLLDKYGARFGRRQPPPLPVQGTNTDKPTTMHGGAPAVTARTVADAFAHLGDVLDAPVRERTSVVRLAWKHLRLRHS